MQQRCPFESKFVSKADGGNKAPLLRKDADLRPSRGIQTNRLTEKRCNVTRRDELGARQIFCREASGLGCTKFEKSDLVSYRSKIVSEALRCAV
jgi:predicted nucleotidyltransferase